MVWCNVECGGVVLVTCMPSPTLHNHDVALHLHLHLHLQLGPVHLRRLVATSSVLLVFARMHRTSSRPDPNFHTPRPVPGPYRAAGTPPLPPSSSSVHATGPMGAS